MDDYCSQVCFSILLFSMNGICISDLCRLIFKISPNLKLSETVLLCYFFQVPVRHLVFMVHGIGQKGEKSNLVDDVGNFRQITAALAERHLTSHQLSTQRVLFIPCQVAIHVFLSPSVFISV